jgi:hypothetical protein
VKGEQFCKVWRYNAPHHWWGFADKVFWRTAGSELYASYEIIGKWADASPKTAQRWVQWAESVGMLIWTGEYVNLTTGQRTKQLPSKHVKVYMWGPVTGQSDSSVTGQSDQQVREARSEGKSNKGTRVMTGQSDLSLASGSAEFFSGNNDLDPSSSVDPENTDDLGTSADRKQRPKTSSASAGCPDADLHRPRGSTMLIDSEPFPVPWECHICGYVSPKASAWR